MARFFTLALTMAAATLGTTAVSATTLLYNQNFESPAFFNNDSGGDFDIFADVNSHYANQPAGFSFAQQYTVETLHIGGSAAFGTGYKDPQNIAGNYVLGLLSNVQDDLIGLSFNVGTLKFFNIRADISSIDLDRQGGPFVPTGATPVFRFSLYDNPLGLNGTGSGALLASFDKTGTVGPAKNIFDWTEAAGALDASGSTNGNVTLRIDLLSGGYAAIDNIRIAASDTPGDLNTGVPEPANWMMMITGFGLVGGAMRRRNMRTTVNFA